MSVLETERLLFRYHEDADLDAYCQMMAEPEFRRLSGGLPLSREEAEKSFGYVKETIGKTMTLLATVYKPDSCYIGRCGLYPNRAEDTNEIIPGEGVLAFYIARPYWGLGLATETGHAFLRYGFEELELSRIVAGTSTSNMGSNRVLQKIGMNLVNTGGTGEHTYNDYELWSSSRT
ncbi:MAG: GNAT family N-acetyltransferase [Armatimonas sp.]